MKVRSWLQWATFDLKNGMGGAESTARSLHLALQSLGIRSEITSDLNDLNGDWDVIHTHGSSPLPKGTAYPLATTRVHTLHGTTLGRIWACGGLELIGPAAYAAYLREWRGILQSQVVLAVQDHLHLLKCAKALGKRTSTIWNAWDTFSAEQPISQELQARLADVGKYFCFVGRGDDAVKNTKFLKALLARVPEFKIVAIPGAGFEPSNQVLFTDRLDPSQILTVLETSRGLLLPSLYEGFPLVALEALSIGIPVIAAPAGGIVRFPQGLKGFDVLDWNLDLWASRIRELLSSSPSLSDQSDRKQTNRTILPTWRNVAESALRAVQNNAVSF